MEENVGVVTQIDPEVNQSDIAVSVQIIEEGPTVAQSEAVESAQIIEEGPRVCPLCSSKIRYFFVNFKEKILMCENPECEFPFGYEDLQYQKVEAEDDASDMLSTRTNYSQISSSSVVSSTAWLDIEKMNRVDEDSQLYDMRQVPAPRLKKREKSKMHEMKIVEDIKGLDMVLKNAADTNDILSNERWINNLKKLQDKSGLKLLKPEELKAVTGNKNELKIDIDNGDSEKMTSIKINITNSNTDANVKT